MVKTSAIVLAILVLASASPEEIPADEQAAAKRSVYFTEPERILNFHSDIVIRDDASLAVTETIEVLALGRQIRRGIYRDFPVQRESSRESGEAEFDIIEVLRDGEPEPYHTVNLSSYTRVYMGKADHFLKPGEYTYKLSYLAKREVTTRADEDELYWNVNGTGWQFSMEKVSAAVTLPEGISPETVFLEGYTGKRGEKGRDFRSWIDEEGRIHFETTRPFLPGECLTILLRWPKEREPADGHEIESAPETSK